MAAVHAREYATAELLTRFAEGLLWSYGSDPDATGCWIFTKSTCLLIANPDGRKKAEAGRLWRKKHQPELLPAKSSRSWRRPEPQLQLYLGLLRWVERLFMFRDISRVPLRLRTRGAGDPAYLMDNFPDQRCSDPKDAAPVNASGCSWTSILTAELCCGRGLYFFHRLPIKGRCKH